MKGEVLCQADVHSLLKSAALGVKQRFTALTDSRPPGPHNVQRIAGAPADVTQAAYLTVPNGVEHEFMVVRID